MVKFITDQHFVVRDRLGRLLVFLARLIKDNKTSVAWDIASNEETSIVVDKNGLATVLRNDGTTNYNINGGYTDPLPTASLNSVAYFILADHQPITCVAKTPLTYIGYKVWKRTYEQTFNLANLPSIPDYNLNVTNGVISVSGNNGNIY